MSGRAAPGSASSAYTAQRPVKALVSGCLLEAVGRPSVGAPPKRHGTRLVPPEGGQRVRASIHGPRGEGERICGTGAQIPGWGGVSTAALKNQRIDHGGLVPCGTLATNTYHRTNRRSVTRTEARATRPRHSEERRSNCLTNDHGPEDSRPPATVRCRTLTATLAAHRCREQPPVRCPHWTARCFKCPPHLTVKQTLGETSCLYRRNGRGPRPECAYLAACANRGRSLAEPVGLEATHEEPPRPYRLTRHKDGPQRLAASRGRSRRSGTLSSGPSQRLSTGLWERVLRSFP